MNLLDNIFVSVSSRLWYDCLHTVFLCILYVSMCFCVYVFLFLCVSMCVLIYSMDLRGLIQIKHEKDWIVLWDVWNSGKRTSHCRRMCICLTPTYYVQLGWKHYVNIHSTYSDITYRKRLITTVWRYRNETIIIIIIIIITTIIEFSFAHADIQSQKTHNLLWRNWW